MENTKKRGEAAVLVLVVFLLGALLGGVGNHVWGERVWGKQVINTQPTRNEIVANNFRMLGGRADGAAAAAGAGAGHSGGSQSRPSDPDMEGGPIIEEPGAPGPEISDEDIPF